MILIISFQNAQKLYALYETVSDAFFYQLNSIQYFFFICICKNESGEELQKYIYVSLTPLNDRKIVKQICTCILFLLIYIFIYFDA